MKVTELRIGNFIGMDLNEFPENHFTLTEIGRTIQVVDATFTLEKIEEKRCSKDYYYLEDFEPIALTEEWLEKFGFISEIGVNDRRIFRHSEIGKWLFVDLEDGKFSILIDSMKEGKGSKNLPYVITHGSDKFVHQLQNQYNALTGKELIIK